MVSIVQYVQWFMNPLVLKFAAYTLKKNPVISCQGVVSGGLQPALTYPTVVQNESHLCGTYSLGSHSSHFGAL